MKNTTLLILFLASHLSYSQGYDFKKYESYQRQAQLHDSIGDYQGAVDYYDSMLQAIDFYPYDYFEAFVSAWKQQNPSKAENYLTQGALKGLDISGWFADELESFLGTDRGKKYLSTKDSLLLQHFSGIDTVSYNVLSKLVESDQRLRDGSKEMMYNDSLNFEALIQLSEERSFPTFPKVGYGESYAWLLLWHHRGEEYPNSDQWQRIIPLINKEIQKGLLTPEFYYMLDNYDESEWK